MEGTTISVIRLDVHLFQTKITSSKAHKLFLKMYSITFGVFFRTQNKDQEGKSVCLQTVYQKLQTDILTTENYKNMLKVLSLC